MEDNSISDFGNATSIIKEAIIRSRYQAAKLVNKELLSLYYGAGKYVSDNSRKGFWGQGAIKQLSDSLQNELPGLRGFSEGSLRKMRLFYEEWNAVFVNRSLITNDLNQLQIATGETLPIDLSLLSRQLDRFAIAGFSGDEFLRAGFTQHYTIIAQEKSFNGRLFYIAKCAAEFWSVEALKSNLRGDLYSRSGAMPSNFLETLPEPEQARRAMRSFKDEYLLDYINIEDVDDPDEKVFERKIVASIKKFILSLGTKFCFIGNQHRIIVDEKEYFIDLLFFNRALHCLVAIELKRGEFKPAQLGQLFFYLSALDEYVRQPDEAPSIGIILCREASRNTVEFAVRDYTKPMGVATYKTKNEMPQEWQEALPDLEDMKKLLDTSADEQESDADE
ncbi:MAG: PDDEXK nuclease domain-containing protein [Desulfarculales bacterium]|jgi:predicted nuclease of restriction endonuclease-like (RecB) superfamily|nr:PDDEXK nuclease domain-containing protein [Desulfarculales bacterium]